MKIAILAKGPTLQQYPGRDPFDLVWGLNQIGGTHSLDALFVMDDLKARLPYWAGPDFCEWLKGYDRPLITSKAYPEWELSQSYPIVEVANFFGLPLGISMYSTVDYMLALAVYQRATEIHLYGVDCANPKREETVRVSIGKWIGVAQSHGIRVVSQPGSFFQWQTNVGVNYEQGLYGYSGPPRIEILAENSTERAKRDGGAHALYRRTAQASA